MKTPAMHDRTYCNPLAIPNYPFGGDASNKAGDGDGHWLQREHRSYRELADPSVLYEDGVWYLYPSCGLAWVSSDFVTWTHHPLEVPIGYAPSIVKHAGRFLLTACFSPVFSAPTPLGPWTEIGPMLDHTGTPLAGAWADPMFFSDDDGRLYVYWGIGGDGIHAAEVDAQHPDRLLAAPQLMCKADPKAHVWERFGDFNEDLSQSYMEGVWTFKHAGRYYLTYACPGTELNSYSLGAYVSDGPLGPFTYQARNPILRSTHGLITGPGHGCFVAGPGGTWWCFYTCLSRNQHEFERRIGLDPAGFDAEGNLFVRGPSHVPQGAPGTLTRPELGNDVGLVPVSVGKRVRASSEAPGRDPNYAVDHVMRTWWQANPSDRQPWLEVHLRAAFTVSAVRLIWAEAGLDHDHGVPPGAMRYRIEASPSWSGDADWTTVLDRSTSEVDLLIDYHTFAPLSAVRARLVILAYPSGIIPSVIDFTVFGSQD